MEAELEALEEAQKLLEGVFHVLMFIFQRKINY